MRRDGREEKRLGEGVEGAAGECDCWEEEQWDVHEHLEPQLGRQFICGPRRARASVAFGSQVGQRASMAEEAGEAGTARGFGALGKAAGADRTEWPH